MAPNIMNQSLKNRSKKWKRMKIFAISFFILIQLNITSTFAKGIPILRDAEIENILYQATGPLFKAANLNPKSVKLYLVNDQSLNAFVAGGQKIFIHTGLILNSSNFDQILGVLAHELGHISGGHLIRASQARKRASTSSLMGLMLGSVAIMSGNPNAGAAAIQLGRDVGIKKYLSFNRTQEIAADQAGLKYLEKSGQSAIGLLEFMEKLQNQELLNKTHQDPYVRTHPLNQSRIQAIRFHIKHSKFSNITVSKKLKEDYEIMKAKIFGYTKPLSETLRVYERLKTSPFSKYAHTMAYFRIGDMRKAIKLIDQLTREYPSNPFYEELKGQIFLELGQPKRALDSLKKSVQLMPDSPLLRSELANIQIQINEPEYLNQAIIHLEHSLLAERNNPRMWRQLGIAYGKLGYLGRSWQALSEESFIRGQYQDALSYAKRAQQKLKAGSSSWLRAEDISLASQRRLDIEK